ncbi:MAG TPA: hypothetical protein VM146_08370 [Steroidobacteraceae bacterium]|nr:hypothetical protein [Steroidobacteraceae bacterium]
MNFVTTGGSLRNSATNTCTVTGSSTTALTGLPTVGTTTIVGAYLYWGGSGSLDSSVTFNGSTVTAQRTFATTYSGVSPSLPFFGAMAAIPANLVNVNANNTFTGLTVNTVSPHCDVSAVVSGWSLIVIYSNPNERVRAVNLYDGLDWFRGSSVTLNPAGFRVPNTNIDGRIAIFTLEGDPANSNAMNGVSEALRFNGNLLDDGINVAGSDPVVQQFDGTINTQGIQTSYGIDVDQYNISAFLSPGQTSGTTIYSSGEDLVLLMAQVVSATSDPGVDLGITKTHTGSFVAGSVGTYTLTVSNSSAALIEREDNTVTVTDTLPAGLTFNSATGTGWTCGATGQVVTCTHAAPLNVGASFPPISLNVNVLETAAASVNNTASVSTPSFELNAANNTVTDTTTVVFPNLSTSTKTVQDLNGGEANPGDTLRYTISLIESAGFAISGVTVVDQIPANVTYTGVVSIPSGASSSFSPAPSGDNDTGVLTVANISVPANGTRTIVFDVVVASVSPGASIDNDAVITNPGGPDANPSAPTVQVSPSQIPGTGTKQLYLWSNSQRLSRTQPTGAHAALTLNGNNQSQTFTLNPPLQTALTLNPGNFTVNLLLARTGSTGNTSRTVTVTLANSALGNIASASQSFTSTTMTLRTFTLNAAGVTAPIGSTFSLVVNNNSNNTSNRSISLTPYSGAQFSRVDLNSATVINVNSVTTWNGAFNGGSAQSSFFPGATVYVRAQISDPFGSFDISSARIDIVDPSNVTQVNAQLMTAQGAPATCNSQSAATCIFQYAYTMPASPTTGNWTVRVTGFEGVEGVTDLGVSTFQVTMPQPSLTILKTSVVLSDPVNSTTLPKRIPSALVRYDVSVTNSGPGTVDANTLVITDPIPANSSMYVGTTSGNPVVFVNGTTPSGLSFNYAANVSYSSAGVAGPWTYTPVPDANGFDAAVRAVRIAPTGVLSAASGGNNPSFTVQFQIRID